MYICMYMYNTIIPQYVPKPKITNMPSPLTPLKLDISSRQRSPLQSDDCNPPTGCTIVNIPSTFPQLDTILGRNVW